MRKIGYLFSGQGSQFANMGADLYQSEPAYRQAIDEAAAVLEIDLTNPEIMDDPQNVQIAILAMSFGIYQTIAKDLPQAEVMAGLSLGEYSALVASGALDYKTAIALVKDRSQYMDQAGTNHPGSMAAILKLDPEKVAQVCQSISGAYPANYNTATQTVIGGTATGVSQASEALKTAGAKRVVPLKVAVASHTPLMQEASDRLARRLTEVSFNQFKVPVISNTTAEPFSADNVKTTLKEQLIKPTHFAADLAYMKAHFNVDTLIEIGPGDTLSKFAKKTLKGIETYHIDNVATLNEVRTALETEA
ncbi:ACP S-malonyltransferase [Fructilactobacillus frigidiflavus]|uniref:ACP S-malonyltransferase n=1 Tax=Fructilactobacillus frigidiflavus TaxID=3242688 RepID=UPI003757695B